MNTSSKSSTTSKSFAPPWLCSYLGIPNHREGDELSLSGQSFVYRTGILRSRTILSAAQSQTETTFGFKWKRRDTFDSDPSLARMRSWLCERYGDLKSAPWVAEHGDRPLLLDAGCGAGMSAMELFDSLLPHVRYLGIDVSTAVDTAAERFAERGFQAAFMQADICNLPLPAGSVDIIFSEGVLHHTDSTKQALASLARLLKKGGRFMFYVYRRKGPLREFTDDYVRQKLQPMAPEKAWEALEPLTKLGIALGKLNAEIDIPRPIDLLDIPAGRINIQRLFYWHVAKAFYHPELSFAEMNHINYDWYAPANAARQSPEEVRRWCAECDLSIEREVVEDAGITIIARKMT
ncbi:MAG: class I SAM-dependent methyltransferase [Elusimicrobia bacterium]|nr:class I SAM-dependent methyltransferase [Elusimicrobiota bacterium]